MTQANRHSGQRLILRVEFEQGFCPCSKQKNGQPASFEFEVPIRHLGPGSKPALKKAARVIIEPWPCRGLPPAIVEAATPA